MAILVRRSNLLAPITDAERVNQAWRSDADAITLDLEDGVVETRKAEARGLVIEAMAAKVQPIGITYPLGVHPRRLSAAEIHRMATDARNLGMKGVLCPEPSWVAPVNAAFTPTAELVAHNKRVREVFAGAVAEGTAAVPLDGRMIDVPVDEWAKVVLAMADACDARDAQKRETRKAR